MHQRSWSGLALVTATVCLMAGCGLVPPLSVEPLLACGEFRECTQGSVCHEEVRQADGTLAAEGLCLFACDANTGCPEYSEGFAGTCVSGVGGGACYPACDAVGGCPDDFWCVSVPEATVPVCLPVAPAGEACGGEGQPCCEGLACSAPLTRCNANVCVLSPYGACPASSVGHPCEGDFTCASIHTRASAATGPGTACTRECEVDADCNVQSNGLEAACVVVDGVGQCIARCTDRFPCQAGFVCEGGLCLVRP